MASFSDHLENALLSFLFKNNAAALVTPGDDIYVALFTAATGLEANAPTAEVSGGAYARQQVTAANWTLAGSLVDNLADIEFPLATAAWGEVTHVAIMSDSAAGDVRLWGALTTARTIGDGDQFKMNAGDLTIALD